MKRTLLYIILLACVAVSCQQRFEESWDGLKTNLAKITVNGNVEKTTIMVYSSGSWTAEVTKGGDWVSLDRTSGSGTTTLHLYFDYNSGLSREAEVTLNGSGSTIVIPVIQKSGVGDPKIIFDSVNLGVPAGSYKVESSFISNVPGKYLKEIVPVISGEGASSWLTDVVLSDKEEPAPTEEFPDAVKHFISFKVAANSTLTSREARIVLGMTDATETYYADSLTVTQSPEAGTITFGAKDIVAKAGGDRNQSFATNLAFASSAFTYSVEYLTPGQEDYISEVKLEGTRISYRLAENTSSSKRLARIYIKFTDEALIVTSGYLEVEQKVNSGSFEEYVIESIDDLVEWMGGSSNWAATDKITLGADLDLGGMAITPHSFAGSFDGKGKHISNFTVSGAGNVAFFDTLKAGAVVKDVVLGSSNGTSWDGVTSFTHTSTSTANVSVGSIASIVTGTASVSGVVNFGPVGFAKGVDSAGAIGGIAGRWASTGTALNCVNYGDVTIYTAKATMVSGVIGSLSAAATIEGCDNRGNVTNVAANTANDNVAGVIASNSGKDAALKNCTNYGTIKSEMPADASATLNLGGVVAYSSQSMTVTACHNKGALVSTGTDVTRGGDMNMGGVLSYPAGTSTYVIDGCTNTGNVTNDIPGTKNMRMGGIVSYAYANASVTLKNCTNEAAITNCPTGTTSSSLVLMAGIEALANGGTGSIENCTNSGPISNSNYINSNYSGGILGYTVGAVNITGCTNTATGTVKNTGFGTNCTHLGGIAGYIYKGQITKDCSNAAKIENAATGKYVYSAGLIGRYEVEGGRIENCTNTGDFVNSGLNTTSGGLRCGGIVGQARYITIIGCTQKANVTNTATGANNTKHLGLIIGLNNTAVATVQDCKVLGGTVSAAGTGTTNIAAIVGSNTVKTVIKNNGIAEGVVVGTTALTSSNFSTKLANGSVTATDNYFIPAN